MFYDEKVVSIRNSVSTAPIEQEININDLFFRKIISLLKEDDNVLDIGTGNGFVLSQIKEKCNFSCNLVGLDNSEAMIKEANKNLNGTALIVKGDNTHLPFDDSSFDIITAKNVTRFSSCEIFRVLKPNGYFIFREYGTGKGLVEIATLFPERLIRSRIPTFYVEKLEREHMHLISLETYYIERTFTKITDLLNVVKSYPFIQDYSSKDEDCIKNAFGSINIKITSDPFILVTQKL
ncbi:MAG: class I SAM-dependent methyltransferase [Clostridiaceae bacterium]|nr:class I SAM-dependent methyltransferase [Clostridiaceae bacterium]